MYYRGTSATLGASEIEGGMENNQTWRDRALYRAARPRDGAVRELSQFPRFYDGPRSEPDLLLSWVEGPQGLQI